MNAVGKAEHDCFTRIRAETDSAGVLRIICREALA
jgi:hypothetical protein